MPRKTSPFEPMCRFFSACLLIAITSCGNADSETHSGGNGSSQASDTSGSSILFEERKIALDANIQDNLARRNAETDGWPSELLHDNAKHEIKDFLHVLLDLEEPIASVDQFLAAGFAGSHRLRPEGLKEIYSDSRMKVLRPELLSTTLHPASEFSARCEELRAVFEGADHLHADLKIISVDREGEDAFSTHALIQAFGRRNGAAIQSNMDWRIHWSGKAVKDDHCLMTGIDVLSYEEFQAPKALLADITGEVFGQHDFFKDEFLLGAGELYRHKDRLSGNSYMGWQGLAIGDINGDGLEDVYVCQPGGLPNRLFLKQADGSTVEAAAEAGIAFMDNSRSALLLDFDNDGSLDLAVSMGPNVAVFYNNGRGQFRNSTFTPLTCGGTAFVHSISAVDIDGDGDLEIYACRYNRNSEAGSLGGGLPVPYHDANNGGRNILFLNNGRANPASPGRFQDATSIFGLNKNNSKFSLAAIWEDFDQDGDTDLYVTNDFGKNNFYRNDGGRFVDVADEIGLGELAASMGATAADFDLDGDVDIYLSNMFSSAGLRIVTQKDKFMSDDRNRTEDFISHARGNFMLENTGDGKFKDVTDEAGVSLGRWTWGARFVDFNNDGYDDLYVPNGFITGPDTGDL
jgi:hypothetical protein